MEKYIMTLDQGTTSSRCVIFDNNANIIACDKREFPSFFPKEGNVEQDAWQMWKCMSDAISGCVSTAGIGFEDICAIGITNQRETTVVWDRHTSKPVYPAIVWQDRRTRERMQELNKNKIAYIIREKTGLIPDSYFSASKLEWILDNVSGVREACDRGDVLFGTVDTWMMWMLSGGRTHLTDYTNASRTMLFNINSLTWDRELLEIFNIPESILPQVRPSSGFFTFTDKNIFGREIPVYGVAGDQQSSLYGHGCLHRGDIKNTYGTGCFLLMNTGKERTDSSKGLLTTLTAGTKSGVPEYGMEGSVFMGGAVITWLRDGLGIINDVSECEALARSVNDTDGVYLVPAFTGLGAPYWDSEARGMICGMTRGTTRAHIVRAALEAIAFQCTDVINSFYSDINISMVEDKESEAATRGVLRVDGAAAVNDLLMQMQADTGNIIIKRSACMESSALGAAFLAGTGCGFFGSDGKIETMVAVERSFEPCADLSYRKKRMQGWKSAVDRARNR